MKSEFTELPSEREITKMPPRSTMTRIHPTAVGKLGIDVFGRAEFNGASGKATRTATVPKIRFKI